MTNVLQNVRNEDYVEYFLYPTKNIIDPDEQERTLKSLLKEAIKIVEDLSENYIWHKDEFKLTIKSPQSKILEEEFEYVSVDDTLPHLYGLTFYGDNIEDEWFIVYLLQQITKKLNDIVVRVIDSDGEFLLIEAANYLPSWADPETCEGRVFLSNGSIHIIPGKGTLSLKEAICKINSTTLASIAIQNAIQKRINNYPDKINDNLHRVNLYLPNAIAAILKTKPNLIAPAVLAFCNRDAIDMKACRAMKYFPPENRVYTNVKFTKCLYAMLRHSKYVPDRKTGWNLPSVNDTYYKAHNLGIRVACGFEILVNQAKPGTETNKDWNNYLTSLKAKNYFRDLLEHSKEYNDLLNKAKEYYANNCESRPVVGSKILHLLQTLEYDEEELQIDATNLPKDDDESWLNVSVEELDNMLEERYGNQNFTTINQDTNPAMFTDKINRFLNEMSCAEGIEFDQMDECKNERKVSFASDTKTEATENRINFDPNAFTCAMQNILNFFPEDDSWDLDSESDMSEYANENTKSTMQQYMDEMDKELAKTTIGDSFVKKENAEEEDVESFKPVDIDVNALKNILESYRSQMGEAGPSSNMLGPIGMRFDEPDK